MKIALLGYGVVGSGVYELLEANKSKFKELYERDVEIVGILVNHLDKYAHLAHSHLFTNSFASLSEMQFDVAVETIGGIHPAFDYVKSLLEAGKSVITSNKDLIAEKGVELHEIAANKGVELSYEASVCGGIPLLKPIRECLVGENILEIVGIVNGTTNFILTKMNEEGLDYSEALSMAQKLGFAEADPTSDVEGLDAIRKITILSRIGLNVILDWKTLPVEGITKISSEDVAYLKKTGKVIKLIGMTKLFESSLYAAVRPVILSKSSKFASINNEFNAVSIIGQYVGELFFSGKGAGKFPTATAVLGDLVGLIQNKKQKINVNHTSATPLLLYPFKATWILRISQFDLDALKDTLFKTLHADDYSITFLSDDAPVYIEFHNLTEQAFIDFKTQIGHGESKHYLVL